MTNVRVFLWAYRKILLVSLAIAHAIAAGVLVAILVVEAHWLVYMLNLLSIVTEPVRDWLWSFVPEASWVRTLGSWIGAGMLWSLSKLEAKKEAIARLVLIDGFFLLTVWATAIHALLFAFVNGKIAKWFNRHYVILKRPGYLRLLAEVNWLRTELASREVPVEVTPTPSMVPEPPPTLDLAPEDRVTSTVADTLKEIKVIKESTKTKRRDHK